ncbi:oxygen-independent coproporphyrinogen III oxidase [Magnetospirillum sp. UT-4]|uniref:oxygen-independent coproporphyrinogen III oxidase n=1 Tax=Magnetospirillum sp. UT-4 TaxID=2681467 RepID=UPI00137C6547|nr:oxygen-independent coproporphyrinogen III oxidase [Magnetospirillum sp. UT-4]CAA7625150.1 Oxygen-independent coproporphyrinogen-III oxidase [Magnetospirillum sp. UT-4]
MHQDLSAKYDLRVPRYTSYPTAPHFHPGIGPDQYGKWLAALDPAEELSLYLHIAYCAEMCWFCGCHTKITRKYAPVAAYMEALLAEIDLIAEKLPARMTARHVHFGGGSPTILAPEDFVRTVDTLRRRFVVRPDAEIAVELDPRTADETYVKAMASAGVTRASIGVQDFDPEVQKAINRIQPYSVTADVIGWLRKHGVPEINVDLVYGLPLQTVDGLLDTIDKAHGFSPRRIALFGYAHVPWMKKHQRLIPDETLPDTDTRWQQYTQATARLEDLGYVKVGLDHFAAPDDPLALALKEKRLHRNFQGYTTDTADTLIGIGASGIGSLPQGYVANVGEIHFYLDAIRAGRLATARGIAIDDDDRLRRDIIMRLMCDLEIDLDAVCAEHGADAAQFDGALAELAPMVADGLAQVSGRRIVMTDQGRTLVRAAAARFDRYLKRGEQRHSKAV